jgi:hypothetical protein
MPYFKNNNVNLLFIHIPKTGGSSLEFYLSNKYNIILNNSSLYNFLNNNIIGIDSSLQHITYRTIMQNKIFFNINMENINIMTIVRNPYQRLVSDLFYYKLINLNSSKEEVYLIIRKYLKLNNYDNHNLPQYLFITDENKKLIPNITILHTETLTQDMNNLGFTDFNNYDNKNTICKDYYSFLNNDSIELINDFYNNDFILFNYEKI